MHDPNGKLKDQTSQLAYSFRTLLYICPMRSAMSPPTFCVRVVLLVSFTVSLLAFCGFAGQPTNQSTPPNEKADSILILKKEHRLELLSQGKVIRTYKIALGQGGLAPKEREGDGRTPEGRYVIDARYANSAYHRALHISYPNAEDRKRAAKLGVRPGGAIMIHGLPNGKGWLGASHRLYEWTLGCVAVTDKEIDEMWNLVGIGTPVEIRP
jgi:murein L,D-transpeptidase YafK